MKYNEYLIAPSYAPEGFYFLYCPNGAEKKFRLSDEGQIIDFGAFGQITATERILIKHLFENMAGETLEPGEWWRGLSHCDKIKMQQKHNMYSDTEKAVRIMFRAENDADI